MKKWQVILSFAALIGSLFWIGVALGPNSKIASLEDIQETEVYYVPITNYFSQATSISQTELKSGLERGDFLIQSGEKERLEKLFKIEITTGKKETKNLSLKEGEIALVRAEEVTPNFKSLAVDGNLLWEGDSDYPLKVKAVVGKNDAFNHDQITKINFGGDVMLSRSVAKKIKILGTAYPWQKIREKFSAADISFINLEVPLSDRRPAPETGMSFIAPTSNIAALKGAGVDLVSVANNHTANFGEVVFKDNLSNLGESGVAACGGGLTEAEARKPVIIEKNGLKFGFLCYSSISGTLFAKPAGAGAAGIAMEPWFRDSEIDIKAVQDDIKNAKKVADVVIVSPHWGVEYKANPSASQRRVAKAMIEAGAEAVIGTHPHVVQGAEIINGRYVNYSLGNLIFDQEWSKETKEGIILETYFYEGRLVSSQMKPILIENYSQPRFLEVGMQLNTIIDRVKASSFGF